MEEINERNEVIEQLLNGFRNTSSSGRNDFWETIKSGASFRPTIYIGVGGFGCNTIRELKKSIESLIPDEQTRSGFGFIGIDTHPAERSDILTGNEYIGVTRIMPHVVANQPEHKKYLGWYNSLPKGEWKARNIDGGANQIRPVGKLAFLYPPTLNKFYNTLSNTYTKVNAFRESFKVTATPKVYLISSLAGGTGAGMFLDVSFIISHFIMSKTNAGNDLQCIIATADSLEGNAPAIQMPDLYTNTYSALKEQYFFNGNSLRMDYSIPGFENLQLMSIHLPNPIYLITGQNKEGRVVFRDFQELCGISVSYLLFEILTPLIQADGGTKVQDKENNDQDSPGNSSMFRFYSSFGVIRFGIPSDIIKKYFSQIIFIDALSQELQGEPSLDSIHAFINEYKLGEAGTDQLQESIRKSKNNEPISVKIDILPELAGIKSTDIYRKCISFGEVRTDRLKLDYKETLVANASKIFNNVKQIFDSHLKDMSKKFSVKYVVTFLQYINDNLKLHQASLTEERLLNETKLAKIREKVKQSTEAVRIAAQAGILVRKKRLDYAISTFEADFQSELIQLLTTWSIEEGLKIYSQLLEFINEKNKEWTKVEKKIEARKHFVTKEAHLTMLRLEQMADINKRGKGNRFSIVNMFQVQDLYNRHIGIAIQTELSTNQRNRWNATDNMADMNIDELKWYENNLIHLDKDIEDHLKTIDIISILNQYYHDGNSKDRLITNLKALGSPLFPLDQNFSEQNYDEYRVIAIHTELKDDFMRSYGDDLVPHGAGKSYAMFPSKDEVIIYSLQHGFTPHSLARMNHYYAHYNESMRKFNNAKVKSSRPYHAWPEAQLWENLIPSPKEEDMVRKYFAVGRALSYLYPNKFMANGTADLDKNEAYIYNKGNYYYMNMEVDNDIKKIKLGNGLKAALLKFGDNDECLTYMQTSIEKCIADRGISTLNDQISKVYLPVIENELERVDQGNDPERKEELKKLLRQIKNYLRDELDVRI